MKSILIFCFVIIILSIPNDVYAMLVPSNVPNKEENARLNYGGTTGMDNTSLKGRRKALIAISIISGTVSYVLLTDDIKGNDFGGYLGGIVTIFFVVVSIGSY